MDRKMTSGGLALIVALVMALVVVVAGQPVINGTKLKNIVDQKDGLVANVQGYVEFAGENGIRHVLNFFELDQTVSNRNPEKHYFALIGDEFVLESDYVHQDKGKPSEHYQVRELFILVRDKNHGPSYSQICSFDQKFTFALPANLRYSCTREQSHQCSKNGKLVANVVLRAFEFELDGNTDQVAKLEFSKPAWEESCEHWSK